MKSYNIKYSNYDELKEFVSINGIEKHSNILVQIFNGIVNKVFIEEIIRNVKQLMPKSKIIGATSPAEIFEGKVYTQSCIISITVFENTKVSTLLLDGSETDFEKGKAIGQKLITETTKVIIAFTAMNIDGEKFLNGISSINSNVIIAGGMAGNDEFGINDTYVFTEEGIGKNVVAVALDSETLCVNNESSFNWVPIGKDHEITSAEGRTIKTIDGIKAENFYKKYTGVEAHKNIRAVGGEFPLMIKKKNEHISLPVLGFTKDNGISINTNIAVGEKVKIGYGNLQEIFKGIKGLYEKMLQKPIESIFVYSCYSRRTIFKESIDLELSPLEKLEFASGFYTFGEFIHKNNNNIYNAETITMLMLSEDKDSRAEFNMNKLNNYQYYNENHVALYNLIKTTGDELNELNLKLEQQVKKKTVELNKQYYKDSLTGLYNRNKLMLDLEESKYDRLAILDIESFNGINDFYGNEIGNILLIEISKLIEGYSKENKLKTYRIGADIFALAANSIEDFIEKIRIMQLIIDSQCFLPRNHKIYLSTSIGLSQKKENLLEKAEMALNYGKRNKKTFQLYKNELKLYEKIEENIIWSGKIKQAMMENRIVPYFQPIVNNSVGVIEKFEALIRMIDEDGSVVAPCYFLEVAKKSGVYKELTRIMIEKIFEVLNSTEYEISINLLLQDIKSKLTRELIIEKLQTAKDPGRIVFEIVESEGIENFDEVTGFIRDVKKYGAKIAIDDFGTGYSNFNYLMKLNVDYIKIDGSIIKNIYKDKSAEIITKTLVSFARDLGIETIAEFVADEQLYNKVNEMNIDYSQGYYISEPKANI